MRLGQEELLKLAKQGIIPDDLDSDYGMSPELYMTQRFMLECAKRGELLKDTPIIVMYPNGQTKNEMNSR